MIAETQCFLIDIICLLPKDRAVELLVQAPYDELNHLFKMISFKKDEVYHYIRLNEGNIKTLLYEIIFNDFDGYIQSLEIKVDDCKIFEGYDAMEYGMFSKKFNLSNEFKNKYVPLEMCLISKEW